MISINHEVTGTANFLYFVVSIHNQKNVKFQKELSDLRGPFEFCLQTSWGRGPWAPGWELPPQGAPEQQ